MSTGSFRKLGKIDIGHDDLKRMLGLRDEIKVVSVVDNFAGLSVIVEGDELRPIAPGDGIPRVDLSYLQNADNDNVNIEQVRHLPIIELRRDVTNKGW